jgi:hypothetical protein
MERSRYMKAVGQVSLKTALTDQLWSPQTI